MVEDIEELVIRHSRENAIVRALRNSRTIISTRKFYPLDKLADFANVPSSFLRDNYQQLLKEGVIYLARGNVPNNHKIFLAYNDLRLPPQTKYDPKLNGICIVDTEGRMFIDLKLNNLANNLKHEKRIYIRELSKELVDKLVADLDE